MNAQEIASAALQAGFSGQTIATVVAIALAESSGVPTKHNTNRGTGDDSYGLMQINMIGEPGHPGPRGEVYGPPRRAQFGIKTNSELFDPATNMRAAFILSSSGTSFGDWTTYNTGAYRKYLDTAQTGAEAAVGHAIQGGGIPTPGDVAGAAGNAIQSLLGLDKLGEQILTVGLSITFTVAALGLIALGLFKLTGKNVGDVIDSGGQAVGAASLAAAAG